MKKESENEAVGMPVEILLVEDNPGDVRLTVEAFGEGRLANKITAVQDGVEAMAYLHREGQYANATRPGLILLDLNLPRKDGREVLEEIKRDKDLKSIPVVILTTSRAEEDILRSYKSYANSYITKPVDLTQFLQVVESIEDFWLTVVKLPRKKEAYEMTTGSPASILLVEDNPGDVRLITEAFSEGKLRKKIASVQDGMEALAYLRREGKYANATRPDVILLDLSLPRKDGREILEDLKRDEDLRLIPVVVLTMSKAEEDVLRAYDSYANSYITKPADMDQFFNVVKAIEDFWLTTVKLPPGGMHRK